MERANRRRAKSGLWQAGLALGTMSMATPVVAQSPMPEAAPTVENPNQLTEIVVTARRREESIQRTPVSITAFSEADLTKRGIANLSGIAAYTPNLVFDQGTGNTGGSTSSQIYIRGIGQADFLFTTEPGVGIYVDGVYYPRSIGSLMDLIDLERVEVLRGPQGTLFGKNSVGGAINIVTKRPGKDLAGRGSVTVGSYGRIDVNGALNVLLVPDLLSAKLSFASNHRDGYVRRVNDNSRLGGINSTGVRGQLLWTPNSSVDVLLSADYTRKREDSIANTLVAADPAVGILALWNALVAPTLGAVYDGRFIPDDPDISYGTGENRSDLDVWGASALATWSFGDVRARSITAYRSQKAYFAQDSDHSPLRYFEQSVTDRQKQVSQEFQLLGESFGGRLDWVLGALYFHEKGRDGYRIIFAPGLFTALEAFPAGIIPGLGGAGNPIHLALDLDGLVSTRIDNDSYSAFAHTSFDLTSRLRVSGGLRYTKDKKKFAARLDRFTSGTVSYDTTTGDEWSAWTPKIGLDYRWTDDLMTYVSAARGFKSGGFNGRPTTRFVAERAFDPELVWTYELGLKSSWANRRLTLNGAIFHSNYTNLQLLSVTADAQGVIVAVVENAGKSRIRGFEVELSALPVKGLRLNGSLGYLDAKYTKLDPAVTSVTLDDHLVKAPKWSISAGAEYTAALSDRWEATIRGDYAYRSRTENVPDNNPLLAQKGYALVNGRLALRPVGGRWEVALFGTNLTAERYITNGLSQLDTLGTADVSFARPREFGVSAKLEFGP